MYSYWRSRHPQIPQAELMRQVSFVFQDTFLFKQSILDNIRMGNPTASEAQVIEAAKAAQCHDFIENCQTVTIL